ncbi:hypothetical protein BDA99DRAFT_35158 [Phascolomyces articulosus]|uniref:Uncharacterized protein n=1 Tax=Phascolomyces articulosus TaxID=60185 RepID=A0AAD5KHU0_9FUNG|nr:hypothetical protein BDA99DRAFT_35158 [Phascolomyces articulosus]
MSTIREEIKRIENIKELLNVPDFWLSKPWQSWSLTLFDLMACQKIWGVTKNQSHCYLKDDAKEILNVLPHCNQKIIPRIRQLLLEMESKLSSP